LAVPSHEEDKALKMKIVQLQYNSDSLDDAHSDRPGLLAAAISSDLHALCIEYLACVFRQKPLNAMSKIPNMIAWLL